MRARSQRELESLRNSLSPLPQLVAENPALAEFCRDYNLDSSAQASNSLHSAGWVQSGDYRLAVHQWQQPEATSNLLLVHGFTDHSGLFSKLVDYGLARRCNVLIFDLPGHGLSSGERCVINDFRDYGQAINDVLQAVRLPELPWWVMAQSMGAAAVMELGRHHGWPFRATVLLAPLVRPAGWRKTRLAHSLLRHFVDDVSRSFNRNSSDQEFLQLVQRDPLQVRRIPLAWITALRRWEQELPLMDLGLGPALVIQGDADSTVDWRYNMQAIARLFPASRIEYLPGAGHQLANESRHYRASYQELVDGYLAGL